ncbi:MAG: hypothetical protein ACYDAR_15980 [Thermomicrobiales bacterium]
MANAMSPEERAKVDWKGLANHFYEAGDKLEAMQQARNRSWMWRLGESTRLSQENHTERLLLRGSVVIELGERGQGVRLRTLRKAMRYIPDVTPEGIRAVATIGFMEVGYDDWIPVVISKEAEWRPSLMERLLKKKRP